MDVYASTFGTAYGTVYFGAGAAAALPGFLALSTVDGSFVLRVG